MPVLAAGRDVVTAFATMLADLPDDAGDDLRLADVLEARDGAPAEARAGLDALAAACNEALRQSGFVRIQGLQAVPGPTATLLACALGTPLPVSLSGSGRVASLTPRLDSARQAHTSDALGLHTDYATMPEPPVATLLHVSRAHPLGPDHARSGVCRAADLLSSGPALCMPILDTPLPFADPDADAPAWVGPVLDASGERPAIRFHAGRVRDGFLALGRLPDDDEQHVLDRLAGLGRLHRQEFWLASGEMLLLDNRRTLHDRTESPLVIHRDGREGRLVHTLFLSELAGTRPDPEPAR